jgi:hypothetical protein
MAMVFAGCESSFTGLAHEATSDHDCGGEASNAMASAELSGGSQVNDEDLNRELKSPKRITITVNYSLYTKLVERSAHEGRSISNLASYLLQRDLEGQP